MAALKFVETHNLVAFLEKPDESDGFEHILDFLNAHTINVRRDLHLEYAEGTECLPTATIFEELARIGKDTEVPQPSGHTEPITDMTGNVESVPTHSNDPLLSGEDSIKLNELIELCTTLQSRVLALETTKTIQALEIESLKRRVKKLKKKKRSRTYRLKRLYKVGLSAKGRNDEEMFDTVTTAGEVVTTASVEVSAATTITTIVIIEVDFTLAQ
ncbi:hypothetical protein Tco_1512239, partial [Tanacetum coccineum]